MLSAPRFTALVPFVGLLMITAGCQVAPGDSKASGANDSARSSNVAATSSSSPDMQATAAQTSAPTNARTLAVNVQGAAPIGATVRVKSIEIGTDATILDVSASYGGTMTRDIKLAGSDTYLLDPQGNRLMLKPPQDNADLKIQKGEMMEGKLVFLGTIAPGAKSVKLVFNDNNDGDSIIDPGLNIVIPLDGAGG